VPRRPLLDHYATLGVPEGAPHADVRAAYHRQIRRTHPDVVRDDPRAPERAAALTAAWTALKDPVRRAAYDRERTAERLRAARTASDAAGPAWGAMGPRPVDAASLREAAARNAAFSAQGQAQRKAFSAATWRIGLAVLLVGVAVLGLLSAAG
jgi:curved DNA-binding protein CbpA